MQRVLKQVSFVQYHAAPSDKPRHYPNGGEVRFTDGTLIWYGQSGLERIDPKIGDGLMVRAKDTFRRKQVA